MDSLRRLPRAGLRISLFIALAWYAVYFTCGENDVVSELDQYTAAEAFAGPPANVQEANNRQHILQLMDFLLTDTPWVGAGSLSARREPERRAEIEARKAEALREFVAMQDEFVDILVQQLHADENASERLARAVLPALQQIDTEKVRAVMLSLAFCGFHKPNTPWRSVAWYYDRFSNASEAQELLNNAEPYVILRALETTGRLDPVLMEHVRRLLQGEPYYRAMAAECLAKVAGPAEGMDALSEILVSAATVDELPKARGIDVWGNPGWVADAAAERLVPAMKNVAVEDNSLLSLVGWLSGRSKWCVVLALAQRGSETIRSELEGMVRADSVPSNFRWAAFKLFCSGAGEQDRHFLETVAETDSVQVYTQNRHSTYPFRVLAKHTLRRPDRARPAISEEGLVPLPVEIPPPMHVDGPNRIMPLLTEDIPTQLPQLLAPPGLTNMALGAVVTSSDDLPIIGDLPQVVDGDKTSSDGAYLELGPGPQWIVIDSQRPCEIYWIGVWHSHRLLYHVYYDVIVQVSGDPDFVDCLTLFNNDHDGSGGFGEGIDLLYPETHMGKWIEGRGVRGRYVRLYSHGNTANDLNQYCEVEVWGRPVN